MKTPLIIKICCMILAARTVIVVANVEAFRGVQIGGLAALAVVFLLAVVGILGYWVMRRWAPILLFALLAFATFARGLIGFDGWAQYPLVGPYGGLVLGVLLLAPAAFYWKQMSWKFFDLSAKSQKGSTHAHS